MYRVYLRPAWREFGIDFADRGAAERAGWRFRVSFPHRRYVVRRCATSR